jgi:hypothetical protein
MVRSATGCMDTPFERPIVNQFKNLESAVIFGGMVLRQTTI